MIVHLKKIGIFTMLIGIIFQLIFSQDLINTGLKAISVLDSSEHYNDSPNEKNDSTLITISSFQKNPPQSQDLVFANTELDLSLREDNQLTIPLSFLNLIVEDTNDSSSMLNWNILPGTRVNGLMVPDSIKFVPQENWFGYDTVTIIASDSGYSDTAYLFINIIPENDSPIFNQKLPELFINEDSKHHVFVSEWFDFVDDPDHSDNALKWLVLPGSNIDIEHYNEKIVFLPKKNWHGKEDINLRVTDGELSDSSSITINVLPINDPPVFSFTLPDTFIFEDNELTIPIDRWFPYVTDVDHDDWELNWKIIPTSNFEIIQHSNLLTINPRKDWNGYAQIQIKVTDGYLSDTSKISIHTIPLNDPPRISVFPDFNINEDEVLEFDLKPYMSDVDNNLIDLTWSFVSDFSTKRKIFNRDKYDVVGANLFSGNQNIRFKENKKIGSLITVDDSSYIALLKPPHNYFAENISFVAQLIDPNGGMDVAMFNVSINSVNDSPIIKTIPPIIVKEDETYSKPLSIWFPFVEDIDNRDNELNWKIYDEISNLSLEIKNDSIFITGENNWYGIDTVTLSVTDGEFEVKTDLIISVLSVNDPPMPFELLSYSKDDSLHYTFKWYQSFDIENDSIEYHFYLMGKNLDTVIHKIKSTHLTFNRGDLIDSNISYSWFVEASDKIDTIRCLEKFDFTIPFVPRAFEILPNYPNPFNNNTIIPFNLPYNSMVKIDIVDISGKLINSLFREFTSMGSHKIIWDGTDKYSRFVSSGIYFVSMEAGGKVIVRKIMYIK